MMTLTEQVMMWLSFGVLVAGMAGARVLRAKMRERKALIKAAMRRHPAGNRI